ncbi:MAG: hypothetical protein QW666_00240 [Candidatus Woesearchaeota archaeon]
MVDATEIRECPDCGSTNIIHGTIREQIICRDCGLIFEPAMPIEVKPGEAAALAKPKKAKKKAVKQTKKTAKKTGTLKKLFKKLTKKKK